MNSHAPCGVSEFGGQLLVHIRARIRQDAVIPLRMIPRHDQRARTARTPRLSSRAHPDPSSTHMAFLLHKRQHFFFYKTPHNARTSCRIPARARSLGHRRCRSRWRLPPSAEPFSRDQIVQHSKQHSIRPICAHNKWRRCAGNVLFRHVNRNMPGVKRGMTGGHNHLGRIVGGRLCRKCPVPVRCRDKFCCPAELS